MSPVPVLFNFNELLIEWLATGDKLLQLDGQFMDTFSQRIEADSIL